MALAELYANIGQPAAALEVVREANVVAPAVTANVSQEAELALLNRRAQLLLKLGQQVGPLSGSGCALHVMLPTSALPRPLGPV